MVFKTFYIISKFLHILLLIIILLINYYIYLNKYTLIIILKIIMESNVIFNINKDLQIPFFIYLTINEIILFPFQLFIILIFFMHQLIFLIIILTNCTKI